MAAERQRCPRDSDWCDGLVCEDVGKIGCPNRMCARLLVGQGSDVYDPICVLTVGHDGPCKPEEGRTWRLGGE